MVRAKMALLVAVILASPLAAFGQTAVDYFYNPRSAGFLQLVDGAGSINFVRDNYGGQYEERATFTAGGQTAILQSSVDEQINSTTMITHSIQIIGNHSLKLMCSGNGVDWYNFCDPCIGGKLSPAYNNGSGETGSFKGPYSGPVSIDFRSVVGGRTHLALRWVATADTAVNTGDHVSLVSQMANWESALNPVNGVSVEWDNATAIVSVDPGYDIRGNIIGIYRSADGGATYQYQGDTNGYFFQQDITNGVQYTYGAERRDIYGNKSARIDAAPGQAKCVTDTKINSSRPGQTRITGINNGGGSVVFNWFARNQTEVPCGNPTPLGWYEIYVGDIGQNPATFSLVGVAGPTDSSWSTAIPEGNKAYIIVSVAPNGAKEDPRF
jgi:hypothetical protein